jgi:hypothetical protein
VRLFCDFALIVLRGIGVILALVATHFADYAVWFRLDGSDELPMIEQIDFELGAAFALALMLIVAAHCRLNLKAWLLALLGAAIIWACVSGSLVWWHREQDRIRSSHLLVE